MPINLTRRDFLKSSAALVAALSVAAWLPAPQRAGGHTQQLPAQLPAAPGFNLLPSSQLATGQPVADISAGWDGAWWAIDTLGIPHLYDPVQGVWQAFGKGVDAVTMLNDELYFFSGANVAVYNQTTGQVAVQPCQPQHPIWASLRHPPRLPLAGGA